MILRVFPRKTNLTPDDNYVRIGFPKPFDLNLPDDISEVHISVLFTWDIKLSENIYKEYSKEYTTKIGGVAMNTYPEDFECGKYVKLGGVITSRGCPNKCWFCSVWKREGNKIRELPIVNGNNILDSNLLACSDKHINKVFDMLENQKEKVKFTGGLEAKLLKDWHVERLLKLKKPMIFFAYDTKNDYEFLLIASKKMKDAGFNKNNVCCYCLIGYRGDTFEKAEIRLRRIKDLNMFPFAMLYRDYDENVNLEWKRFQRKWIRGPMIYGEERKGKMFFSL